ncbi:MAG: glycosyltransferase [Nanoarchaeota archaeon]
MEILPYIYLGYMFVGLYIFFLFVFIYYKNRKELFAYPRNEKEYTISVLIPAYNEEDAIGNTIEAVMSSTVPFKEVIVINDGSRDKTAEIVRMMMKRHNNLKLFDKLNSGKADSLNQAIKIAKGELIAVVDADSYPEATAVEKMLGFFNDGKVGAVTCAILVKNTDTFLGKLQAIEYRVIAWTRKLLGCIDSIYVTPGPLAIYRKRVFLEAGGFDTKNLTEDIELTWHLAELGWRREMCLATTVHTTAPSKFKQWFKQRIRWDMGGLQTIYKYRQMFLKKGMLGFFILPFFITSLFLGVLGIGVFVYVFSRRFLSTYFQTRYSFLSDTPIISLDDLFITPSVLNFFGIFMFLLGFFFTLFALKHTKKEGSFNMFILLFYMVFYLLLYPIILIVSIYKLAKKDIKWGTK